MIERSQRRAFSASRDVGVSEAAHDVDPQPRRRRRAVEQLSGEPPLRSVKNRLPMQSGQRHRARRDPPPLQKRGDGFAMGLRDRLLQRAEIAVLGALGIGDRLRSAAVSAGA